jgi:hypothetical protein
MSFPDKFSDLKPDQLNLLRRFTRGPAVVFFSRTILDELKLMGLIEEQGGQPMASVAGRALMAGELRPL